MVCILFKASGADGASAASGSDYEQDHVKMSSLPPGRVDLGGSGDVPATQIACGLQHTGNDYFRLTRREQVLE